MQAQSTNCTETTLFLQKYPQSVTDDYVHIFQFALSVSLTVKCNGKLKKNVTITGLCKKKYLISAKTTVNLHQCTQKTLVCFITEYNIQITMNIVFTTLLMQFCK